MIKLKIMVIFQKIHNFKENCKNKSNEENEEKKFSIYPDIIIQKRGKDDKNLVIIELKKHPKKNSSFDEEKCDKDKIKMIKKDLGYSYGCFINS